MHGITFVLTTIISLDCKIVQISIYVSPAWCLSGVVVSTLNYEASRHGLSSGLDSQHTFHLTTHPPYSTVGQLCFWRNLFKMNCGCPVSRGDGYFPQDQDGDEFQGRVQVKRIPPSLSLYEEPPSLYHKNLLSQEP